MTPYYVTKWTRLIWIMAGVLAKRFRAIDSLRDSGIAG